MRDHRKKRKPEAKHIKLAEDLRAGKPIQTAMLDAGYAPSVARVGVRSLPKCVIDLLPRVGNTNLLQLGRMTVADQKDLVIGRLAYNAMVGQDKGVLSAKALGSQKELNLFTADIQTGIVIVQMPGLPENMPKLLEATEEDE